MVGNTILASTKTSVDFEEQIVYDGLFEDAYNHVKSIYFNNKISMLYLLDAKS